MESRTFGAVSHKVYPGVHRSSITFAILINLLI